MTVLSEECVRALQAATAAACVETLNAAPPGELWTHVLAVVYPVIRAHVRKHIDRLGCLARLPDELLAGIFQHLPFWDRMRAAAVCTRWRTVSMDAVSLWADIPHLQNVDTYERLLARTRDGPVAITYWPGDLDDLELFCWILSPNLGRIKSLRLLLPDRRTDDNYPDDDGLLDDDADLYGFLSEDTPILQSLVLSDPREIFSRMYSSLPLLKSAMLRAIKLDGFHMSYLESCASSPILHTLSVMTPETYSMLSLEDWSRLTQFPALETLSLYLEAVFTADLPARSPRLPHSLQHLYLRVHPEVFDVIAHIEDLSRLQTLDIHFLDRHAHNIGIMPSDRHVHATWLASLLPFIANTTVSAAVDFASWSLLATDISGRRRVFCGVYLVRNDWHSILPNVTKLWLNPYRAIPAAQGMEAAFPALEELTLGTTTMTGFTRGRLRSFVREALVWPPLSCSRLRTVRVISETERQIVPAGEVLDYLKRTCPAPRRLVSLVFDGLTLSHDPGVNLDPALYALAENVAAVQSAEVPPESYSVWANSWDWRGSF